MSRRFTAEISREGEWYVAHCVELGVVSQGKSIEEAQANLKEAVELYLESFGDEDIPESTVEVVFYPLYPHDVTVGTGFPPPAFSGRELISALTKLGFEVVRKKGSHVSIQKENFRTVVPQHDKLAGTLLGILNKQCDLSREDLLRVLGK